VASRVKAFNNSLLGGAQRTSGRTGASVRGSVTTSLASLVQQGVNHIKMWIPSSRHLYLTRIVDALMEQRGGSSLGVEEQYEYYDPKVTNPHLQNSMPRKNTPYTHAVVFVIGGGNYVEFQNLQDYAKVSVPVHVCVCVCVCAVMRVAYRGVECDRCIRSNQRERAKRQSRSSTVPPRSSARGSSSTSSPNSLDSPPPSSP
jgi:hypothetical protein